MRDGAVEPRARPARRLLGRGGRVGLRPAPAGRSRPIAARSAPRRWWCGRPRRGRCSSNTGVAVHPDLTYAVVDGHGGGRGPGRRRSSARARRSAAGSAGPDLVGLRYRRPFDDVRRRPAAPTAGGWCRPTSSPPTRAPGSCTWPRPSGRSTARSAGSTGCPRSTRSGPDGRFTDAVAWLAGRPVREANHDINDRLESAGSAGAPRSPTSTPTRTAGAAAPRSSTGASPAGTSPRRLARTNCWPRTAASTGIPSTSATAASASGSRTTSTGRSRGTASGGRRCRSGAAPTATCGASESLDELSELAGRDVRGVDPHRPAIDEVTFACPECVAAAASARRRPRWPVGSSRSSTPGSTRGRCRPPRSGTRIAGALRPSSTSRPTSSPRPSTRPGGGSTRCWP